jgi:predicted nucleotidyltransferase
MAKPESSTSGGYAEKAEGLLKELACRRLGDSAVILFGSRADGTHNRRSDFDIAYLPREGFDPMNVVRLREDIEERNVIYGVDLVDLSNVEESFRDKVLSEGIVWKS